MTDDQVRLVLVAQLASIDAQLAAARQAAELEQGSSGASTAAPQVQSTPRAQPSVPTSVVKAFSADFVKSLDYLDEFVHYIDFISCMWKCTPDMLAPIGSLVQASGMGKSRLMVEAAKQRFTMLICLRDLADPGFPLRSGIADRIPTRGHLVKHWLLRLLVACIRHLVDSLQSDPTLTPAAWIDMQCDPAKQVHFWDAIVQRMDSDDVITAVARVGNESPWTSSSQPAAKASGTAALDSLPPGAEYPIGVPFKRVPDIRSKATSLVCELAERRDAAYAILQNEMSKLQVALSNRDYNHHTGLVFAFDEASHLIPPPGSSANTADPFITFDRFREFFSCIAKCNINGVICMLIDTSVTVGLPTPFVPPTYYSSMRSIRTDKLAIPYVSIFSLDAGCSQDTFVPVLDTITAAIQVGTGSLETLFNDEQLETRLWSSLRHLGRPIWFSLADTDVRSTVRVAVSKLCAADDPAPVLAKRQGFNSTHPNMVHAYRAVASSLVCPPIKALDMPLTAIMTERFMALCTSITSDYRTMTILYPSDPVLAEGAQCALKFAGNDARQWVTGDRGDMANGRWETMVTQLSSSFDRGFMERGGGGQLAAKIILVAAASQATWDASPNCCLTMPVTVARFLSSIFGDAALNTATGQSGDEMAWHAAFSPDLLDGVVFFNHFASTEEDNSIELLDWAFNRCAAIHCRKEHPATDFVIPVLLRSGELTMLMIQVNNRERQMSDADISDISLARAYFKLSSDKGKKSPPYLVIVMSFRQPQGGLVVQGPKRSNNRFMIVAGGLKGIYGGIPLIAGELETLERMSRPEYYAEWSVDFEAFMNKMV
ncbi:hypothetical protein BC831DRAFT_491129 [Entophlyctis helioformis]|nr:hypothetical protein BC831DRAFT_491129 [Entophlyctis helioformis]